MEYIVTLGLLKPGVKDFLVEWDPVEVEAQDKWYALVAAVRGQGLERLGYSMSDFWRGSSVVVKFRNSIRKLRFVEEVACVAKVTSVKSKSKKRLGETLVVEEVIKKTKKVS